MSRLSLWSCFTPILIVAAQYNAPPLPTVAAAPPQPQYGASNPVYNSAASTYPWLAQSVYDPVINHVCTDDTNFSYTPSTSWKHGDYSSEHHRRHRHIHRVTCSRLAIKYEDHCTRCCRIAAQPVPGVSPHVVKGMILSHKHKPGDKSENRCICCAPELPPDQTYYQNSLVQPAYPQQNYQQPQTGY
ncbi:unnamed protein product, partial [Mesorhabditis belari]|uniref:Uncharacterized protein n=1 Tax=Mesorhabditis belari TaxID=2138241 RepID=A0AAF3FBT1_9BILA